MISNIRSNLLLLLLTVVSLLTMITVKDSQAQRRASKPRIITVEGTVTNQEGVPVSDVVVSANEGSNTAYTGVDGTYSIQAFEASVVLFEAFGYEDFVLDLFETPNLKHITLRQVPLFTGEKSTVFLPQLIEAEHRSLVGAVSTIRGDQLITYPDALLSNVLQGKGLGLIVTMNTGGMANNNASMYLRGLSSNTNNQLVTVVDGIERPIDDLLPEEIESIELLKDATSKILMGSRAAPGVLMVTTKRGQKFKKNIHTSLSYGMGMPTRMPQYLDSYQYAVLHNEARLNDGLTPLYSDADILGYRNSSGVNDLRYPNVDYYDYFLNKTNSIQKATTQFTGGNNNIQYAVVMGYLGYTGLQKYGDLPRNDRFNVRGNIDLAITNAVSAFMGMGSIIEYWKRGGLNHAQTFSSLSTHRPNEYPLILAHPNLPETEEEQTFYGASYDRSQNLLSALSEGGDGTDEYISNQMNFGLNFDLGLVTEGLSAKTFVTFDNYYFGIKSLNRTAPTYAQRWLKTPDGRDSVVFDNVLREVVNNDYSLSNTTTVRNQGFNAKINYSRSFGDHSLVSDLGFFYYHKEVPGSGNIIPQDIQNTNTFLRTNYGYNNKYFAEFTLAAMGSNRFEKGDHVFLAHAIGASWILSEESFIQSLSSINYLKLKTSWGILGYDATTPHLLYNKRWITSNNDVNFGERNSGSRPERVYLVGTPSPGLTWEKSKEFNIGLEGLTFNHRLSFEINYFNENRVDIIQQVGSLYSNIYPGSFIPYRNWGDVSNKGIEGEMHWHSRIGNFNYRIGGNLIWSKNRWERIDEIAYPDEYRRRLGQPTDMILGYESVGLFGKDTPMTGHPHQTFGPYAIGDIAYRDLNGDNEINDLDRTSIGNNFPRASFGFDLDLSYKGFGLYILATGSSGVQTLLNNSYYINKGIDKYSVLAQERFHPVNNPDGQQPRLTTTEAANNTVNSDFWLADTGFFRLKNVELSYTFYRLPHNLAKNVKVYARATNMLVLSKVKELDPEVPNSGVNNYPLLSSILGGVSISF
jgi:TonB-dependent starch-binding outer membrane protein SusC